MHYPFFHLQTEGFWYLEFKPEFNGLRPKTTNKLKAAVEYACLDSELFDLLKNENFRIQLIDAIIAAWFYDNQNELEEILQINQNFQNSTLAVETSDETASIETTPRWSLKKSVIRNAFFRKAVVHIYNYKCAFCGLKVTKSVNQNIVDGAHIKPFSQFYDSRINNGISFCKNHHWAFDRGWFAVDEQYKIIVSKDLQEDCSHAKPMKEFHGEELMLPNSEQYFPEIQALEWHRQNVFQG